MCTWYCALKLRHSVRCGSPAPFPVGQCMSRFSCICRIRSRSMESVPLPYTFLHVTSRWSREPGRPTLYVLCAWHKFHCLGMYELVFLPWDAVSEDNGVFLTSRWRYFPSRREHVSYSKLSFYEIFAPKHFQICQYQLYSSAFRFSVVVISTFFFNEIYVKTCTEKIKA